MFMKKLKKNNKWIIVAFVVVVISVLTLLIYNNLFKQGTSERLEGIENYKLTKDEISLVKESLNEIESVTDIDISTNYKIIKIFLEIEEDVDFDDVVEISNKSLENFSEDNLSFYDVELFIDCLDETSEIYPKIGYKYKTNSEFTWNR